MGYAAKLNAVKAKAVIRNDFRIILIIIVAHARKIRVRNNYVGCLDQFF